ncbi:MAG: RNA polymerase sigma-70 factor [Marinilabiliaceae bacterium]|nr:RNA polymerase sigma-70 factor [Marinilabiliaceae bacterium]
MNSDKLNSDSNPLNDSNAFRVFFEDFFPVLTVFAKKYVNNDGAAHDIAQEGFISAWEKRSSIKKRDDVRFYLYTVVRNKCLNYIKHEKVKRAYEEVTKNEEEFYFETVTIEHEVFLMLHKAINELAPQTQEILNLSLHGLGNNEIGDQLDISINTIKTLKSRAYKKLNQQLKNHFYLFFL